MAIFGPVPHHVQPRMLTFRIVNRSPSARMPGAGQLHASTTTRNTLAGPTAVPVRSAYPVNTTLCQTTANSMRLAATRFKWQNAVPQPEWCLGLQTAATGGVGRNRRVRPMRRLEPAKQGSVPKRLVPKRLVPKRLVSEMKVPWHLGRQGRLRRPSCRHPRASLHLIGRADGSGPPKAAFAP